VRSFSSLRVTGERHHSGKILKTRILRPPRRACPAVPYSVLALKMLFLSAKAAAPCPTCPSNPAAVEAGPKRSPGAPSAAERAPKRWKRAELAALLARSRFLPYGAHAKGAACRLLDFR